MCISTQHCCRAHPVHFPRRPNAPTLTLLAPAISQLLPLLMDSNADVRQAASLHIGRLGAALAILPAQSAIPAPVSAPHVQTLLFDWAAATLVPKTPPAGQAVPAPLPTPYQVSILGAVDEALKAMQSVSPASWSTASSALDKALTMCINLLEATSTGPSLMQPILATLKVAVDTDAAWVAAVEAAPATPGQVKAGGFWRHSSPMSRRFTDVIDLLLGWSLHPHASPADRALVHDLFFSLKPYWRIQLTFAADLAANMAADLETSASPKAAKEASGVQEVAGAAAAGAAAAVVLPDEGQHGTGKELAEYLRLLSSFVAVFKASCPSAATKLVPLLPQMLRGLRSAYTFFAPSSCEGSATPKEHGQLVDAACAAVQQLLPAVRDAVESKHFTLPATGELAAVLGRPCLDASHAGTTPVVQAHGGTEEEEQELAHANSADDRHVLPEVRAVVAAVFGRVQGQMPAASDIQAAASHVTASKDAPAAVCTKPGSVIWACGGCLELLTSLLSSPALQPPHLQPILSACALVLVVAAGADEEGCLALACESRLLGQPGKSISSQSWQGVWSLRTTNNLQGLQAASSLVCDLLSMPGKVSDRVLQHVLGELACKPPGSTQSNMQPGLQGLTDLQQQQVVGFNIAVLQAACGRGGLEDAQIAQVCKAARNLLTTAASDDLGVAPCLHSGLIPAVFDLWKQCLILKRLPSEGPGVLFRPHISLHGFVLDAAAILAAHPGHSGLAASVADVLHSFLEHAAAGVQAQKATAAMLEARTCSELVEMLSRLASSHDEAVRLQALKSAFALANLHHSQVSAASNTTPGDFAASGVRRRIPSGQKEAAVEVMDPLDLALQSPPLDLLHLPLQLSCMAIHHVADTSKEVAAAALALAVATADAPLAALASPAAGYGTGGVSPGQGTKQLSLGAPSWHDAAASRQHSLSLRPPQLARMFELLFQESTPGGVLLRRRVEAEADDSLPHGASAASGSSADADSSAWQKLARSLSPADQTIPEQGVGTQSTATAAASNVDDAEKLQEDVWLEAGNMHNSAQLAWLVIQEAAKQCVVNKMRTHMGGPGQSFAGLEKLLQLLLVRLSQSHASPGQPGIQQQQQQQQPTPGQALPQTITSASTGSHEGPGRSTEREARGRGGRGGRGSKALDAAETKQVREHPQPLQEAPVHHPAHLPPPTHQACWLVLEFVGALERCIYHACEGAPVQAPLHHHVLAFFATNRKVLILHDYCPQPTCSCMVQA